MAETCKDCTNKCIMYEPDMRCCENKMKEGGRMNVEKLTMLLQDCSQRPELYNRISNILYENFGNLGNLGSIPALLVTWVVIKYYDAKED